MYSNTYQVTYRRIHASILIMAQNQTTSSRRINNPRDAHDSLGMICTFMRKGLKEYGRIVNVTATSIRIERMQQTANGDFILHPNQKNFKTVMSFSHKITIVAAAAAAEESLRGGIKRRYPNSESTGWLW